MSDFHDLIATENLFNKKTCFSLELSKTLGNNHLKIADIPKTAKKHKTEKRSKTSKTAKGTENRFEVILVSNKVNIFFFFNRFACFWPKGYQLGSLERSHQNGDYFKKAMRKIVFSQESNLQPLDYRSTALPLELEKTPPRMLNFGYLPHVVEQWIGNPKAAGAIPVGKQFLALLVLSSCRSGGFSLGFRAGSL